MDKMEETEAQISKRRSMRLQGYDYSRTGAYFVTICTQNHECLFGNAADGNMTLNQAGQMVYQWYLELENKYLSVTCDKFVCMPNHTHFIIFITSPESPAQPVGADLCVRPCPDLRVRPSLPQIVQWFKIMTTNAYIYGVKQYGWPGFAGKLWQRNYWERVVRNEKELNSIREYIQNNPAQWEMDKLHPDNIVPEPLIKKSRQ